MPAPLAGWLAICGLSGLWFLIRAATIRWRAGAAGWRMALFAAGFALVGLTPTRASGVPATILLVIAASAEMFVGWSALRAARR